MSIYRTPLQAFLRDARKWESRLLSTTYSKAIVFTPTPTGEFSVTAYWETRGGKKGQYSKMFTIEYLFGAGTARTGHPTRSVCACMREFAQEVLHARGI